MTLRAIETVYRGYRFRSRLEARWAVFLDAAAIRWQYEVEGFDLDGVYYLPDFWLPMQRAFLEIKPYLPPAEWLANVKRLYATLCKLANASQREVFLLTGSPNPEPFYYDEDDDDDPCKFPEDRPRVIGFAPDKGPISARLFECQHCDRIAFRRMPGSAWEMWCDCRGGASEPFEDKPYSPFELSPRIREAMTRARQARFEHGEDGDNARLT
jgi:hypothetical protein